MTQIDVLYPQIDTILNQLINIVCDYEQGKDVDLDAKANETNHALQALIATQVKEAYKRGYIDGAIAEANSLTKLTKREEQNEPR